MLLPDVVMYFFIFIFGLCIGSFLNVVVYRLEKGEGFVGGRSYCPHCKHALSWLDLMPVMSFLWLGGKCRYCGKKISWQYPAVEIATGLTFLLISLPTGQAGNFQFPISTGFSIFQIVSLLFLLYIASSLIIIFVYDLKYYLIPDSVLFPAIAIAFIYRLWHIFSIWNYGIAVAIAAGFFLFIFLISKGKWMGFGDVKLAILLGLILGFPNILVGLFLSFFFGAILGVILMLLSKKGLKSEVPFAPFLILGTFVALFFGNQIVNWYLNFLLIR